MQKWYMEVQVNESLLTGESDDYQESGRSSDVGKFYCGRRMSCKDWMR